LFGIKFFFLLSAKPEIVVPGSGIRFRYLIFEMSTIFKMAAKTRHKKWAVKIQHCPISSKFDMWVDNHVPN
jgi:hypothetical protein